MNDTPQPLELGEQILDLSKPDELDEIVSRCEGRHIQ